MKEPVSEDARRGLYCAKQNWMDEASVYDCDDAGQTASNHLRDALEYSLHGIDYGKVEDEERAFRAQEREERTERAVEWLRNAKRIFIEQRRLPFATMRFSPYKRTRARRRTR